MVKHMKAFKWMEPLVPIHIPHEHEDIMARKSLVFPLKVLLHDPKYHAECVPIMDSIIKTLQKCYKEAGRGGDFPKAYVPLGGDYLVQVRMEGAKLLRQYSHTREERLDQLSPVIVEFFHLQQDLLHKLFKMMFDTNTTRQNGSLAKYKVLLERKNVNGNVKSAFEAHQDFILTVTESLILEFARTKLGMKDIDDTPTLPNLPENIDRMHKKNRLGHYKSILDMMVSQVFQPYRIPPTEEIPVKVVIGDETLTFKMLPSAFKHGKPAPVVIQRPTGTIKVNIPVPASLRQVKCNDDVYNYNMNLLQWGLHIIDLGDIIREGDIVRMSAALRRGLPFFFAATEKSHYFTMSVDYLMKTEVLLPARVAMRVKVASYANKEGKAGIWSKKITSKRLKVASKPSVQIKPKSPLNEPQLLLQ